MTNQNQPVRDYLGQDFLRLAVTLLIVVISMIVLSGLERRSGLVSHLITLPAQSSPSPSPFDEAVKSPVPSTAEVKSE